MYPVEYDLPGLLPFEQREARRVARRIASRTGTRAFFNNANGKLVFVYGDEPHGGPLAIKFRLHNGIAHHEGHDIDNMVLYVNMGKIGRTRKDRIAANNAKAEAQEREQSKGRFLDGKRKDAEDYAVFLSRRRRGVATVISA